MNKPNRLRRVALLVAAVLVASPLTAAPAPQDDLLHGKELEDIAEEQALLHRQLERLRKTMKVLLERIEAEGRTHTAELLREGLTLFDELTGGDDENATHLTLEARMIEAKEAAERGRLVYFIEQQNLLISQLERLLDILHDRKNLEALEERIEELRELQDELGALSSQESELRRQTQELREQTSNDAQKSLERALSEMIDRQRAMLGQNEELGRASGTLELEQLERQLEALIADQEVDRAVLSAWDPEETAELAEAKPALEQARRAEAQGARLDEAAAALRGAARELRSRDSELDTEQIRALLEEAAHRAERHERVSGDAAAKRVAEAYRRSADALEASGASEAEEAANDLESEAAALERAADEARIPAEQARQDALEALEELAARDSAAGAGAESVREALEEARAAADRGEDTRTATETAAKALERAQEELEFLGEALSASQSENAERADRLERGLSTLPQGKTESGARAGEALQRAGEAMREASADARGKDAESSAESASEAKHELEAALEDLRASREDAAAAAEEQAGTLAADQKQAAEETGELREQVESGSMSPEAQESVESAIGEAAEAMEQASGELSEGRSASAAGSQRQALDALQRARSEAREGVTPSSPEDQARAEELAAEQERIREEILDLARRIDERKSARPTPSMDRAAEAAEQATEELTQGDLSEAEKSEEEVERELNRTRDQLEEEEEQYQRLRQEEALFRMAEEVINLIEEHAEQMAELVELDAQRPASGRPTRAQMIRLRRISRKEAALATRSAEIADAIEAEGALVSAQLMRDVESDMDRIAHRISEPGGFETGERTQALGRDVEENLRWLLEALRQEQSRRQQEQSQGQQEQQDQQGQNQPQGPPPLIPDATELKLLRRMEVDLQEAVKELLALNPELEEGVVENDLLLEDITRLANRHERITILFQAMRMRIGIDPPPGEGD